MHSLNLSATMFLALVAASAAHAQTSGKPDLERRVDTLENKLDRVLDLLEKRSTLPGSNVSRESLGGAVVPAASAGFVPGMYLDLFASGIGLNLKASYNAIPEPVQLPRSRPTTSIAITPRDTFDYGGFLDRAELVALTRTGNSLVGVGYSSALQVRRNGPHEFVVSIRARETRHPAAACSAALYLNKQKVASAEKSANMEYASSSGSSILASGNYDFYVYTVCSGVNSTSASSVDFASVGVEVLMSEPGDRAPKQIPVDRFFIKAQ